MKYNKHGNSPDRRNTTNLFRRVAIPFILSHADSTDRAFDIGCGNGRLTFHLGKHYSQVVGIDKQLQEDSRHQRENITYYRQDLDQYKKRKKFDLVMLWHVFYAISDREVTLAKLCKLLNPGGLLVIADDKFRREEADREQGPHDNVSYNLTELIEKLPLEEVDEIVIASYSRMTLLRKNESSNKDV
jgi:2-polyprenyl-3-methyl-5-hydroxy-6-metoxy-1,4-benzoquinol methylase